ncbi:hypothetical protein J4434_03810 [Candidatus Woesearchaeota archaeon]|nr:hypothetical protein [Candidatus Woesearchaeota archaeon]
MSDVNSGNVNSGKGDLGKGNSRIESGLDSRVEGLHSVKLIKEPLQLRLSFDDQDYPVTKAADFPDGDLRQMERTPVVPIYGLIKIENGKLSSYGICGKDTFCRIAEGDVAGLYNHLDKGSGEHRLSDSQRTFIDKSSEDIVWFNPFDLRLKGVFGEQYKFLRVLTRNYLAAEHNETERKLLEAILGNMTPVGGISSKSEYAENMRTINEQEGISMFCVQVLDYCHIEKQIQHWNETLAQHSVRTQTPLENDIFLTWLYALPMNLLSYSRKFTNGLVGLRSEVEPHKRNLNIVP